MRLDLETGTRLYSIAVRYPTRDGRKAAEVLADSCRLARNMRGCDGVVGITHVDELDFAMAFFGRRYEAERARYALGGNGWDVAEQLTRWTVDDGGLPIMN